MPLARGNNKKNVLWGHSIKKVIRNANPGLLDTEQFDIEEAYTYNTNIKIKDKFKRLFLNILN